jgi:Flp pilus assembly protein CpaB
MEASSARRIGGKSPRDIFSSRRGTIIIAAGAAVLAGVLLFVFVQQYRKSVNNTAANAPVFVATGYIPRGTAASLVASDQLLQRTLVKSKTVQRGAITDPTVLHGEVAIADIYPGQQITATDFSATGVGISSQLTANNRAIAVPVDAAHGLVGFVSTGDHVDLLSSFTGGNARGAVSAMASNVLVLSAPGGGGGGGIAGTGNTGGGGGNIVLSVSTQLAPKIAYVADNGKLWVLLRPPAGAIGSTTKAGH